MIFTWLSLAFAEDPTSAVDVPADPPAAVPAPAPEAAPSLVPADPRALRIAGAADVPVAFGLGPGKGKVEHRFFVVGAAGPLTVAEILASVGDPAVQARRKREVTLAAVIGSLGLATAAGMLAVHSIEAVNDDPTLEPLTAVIGTLGFGVGVVSIGVPLQSNKQPWRYWSEAELESKLAVHNAGLPGSEPPSPAE